LEYNLESNVNFDNNIAVLRTSSADKGYLAFFANFNSLVHKHKDDLSFIFQSLGIDIFTDQGYYGYDKEYRPMLTSSFAHNTFVVNNQEYQLDPKKGKSRIIAYRKDTDYEMIEAKHNHYDSLELKRKIFFIKPNIIVINDKTDNLKAVKSLTQYFNLGDTVIKTAIEEGAKYTAMFPNNIELTVSPIGKDVALEEQSFYRSIKPFDLTEIRHLSISNNKNNLTTLINIFSPEYGNPITNVFVMENVVYYTKKGVEKKLYLNQ